MIIYYQHIRLQSHQPFVTLPATSEAKLLYYPATSEAKLPRQDDPFKGQGQVMRGVRELKHSSSMQNSMQRSSATAITLESVEEVAMVA